ncbi:MAG: glycosyltransferase family 2 protein [Rhodobacteraceae bacterium]|nr:glycosyltransferase family 2 protein [Paracoccaceae bacterium]
MADALNSLLAQSFTEWQAILVDDGSTDGTTAIIATYCAIDTRFSTFRQENLGPSIARNRAAQLPSKSEYIAFLDADDLWTPEKLSLTLRTFNSPSQPDVVYGIVNFFTRNPRSTKTKSTPPKGRLGLAEVIGENPVCTLSNLSIRRALFLENGGFNVTMRHSEDLEFLIRIIVAGAHIKSINTLLVHYRTRAEGLSANLWEMHLGWRRAIASAAALSKAEINYAEAIHLRYLARRALRTKAAPLIATKLALHGFRKSPRVFLMSPYRGWATLLACLIAPFLPAQIRHMAFSE